MLQIELQLQRCTPSRKRVHLLESNAKKRKARHKVVSVTVPHGQPVATSVQLSDFDIRQDWWERVPAQRSHLRMRSSHVKPLGSKVFISDKGPTWRSILVFSALSICSQAQRHHGVGVCTGVGVFLCVCLEAPVQGLFEMTKSQWSWCSYHFPQGCRNQPFMPLGSPRPHPCLDSLQTSCSLTFFWMGLSEFPCWLLFLWVSRVNVLPLLKKWSRICFESQDSIGRKLAVAVSVGDVSTTRSKFLEPEVPQRARGRSLARPAKPRSETGPGEGASHTRQACLGLWPGCTSEEPLLQPFVTWRNFTDNSAVRAFAGYQVPHAFPPFLGREQYISHWAWLETCNKWHSAKKGGGGRSKI